MLFNGRALIFTFSGTQVRIAEIERLQSLFKTSMTRGQIKGPYISVTPPHAHSHNKILHFNDKLFSILFAQRTYMRICSAKLL